MSSPVTILFLGANPSDTTRLALDREVREIKARLRASDHRDAFRIEQEWAVRLDELQACLLRHRPTFVHFSGHGSPYGELLLEDERGHAIPAPPASIARLCRILGRHIRGVLLNACFSDLQAAAIAEHIDWVVGMSKAVDDRTSIAFAGAFYQALGYGESVEVAFELGCNQIELVGLAQSDVPRLLTRGNPAPARTTDQEPAPTPHDEMRFAWAHQADTKFGSSKAGTEPAPVDFLIFAPLEEERDAFLAKLPEYRKLDSDGSDAQVYFAAEVATRRQDEAVYRLVVTSPAGMGPIQAAITASAATVRWKPEHVLVVGIAGGLKDEVSLGDVMVARMVADYTVGKVDEDGTREERWESYPADAFLLNAANAFGTGWEDLIATERPEGAGKPVRRVGIIASGGDVIASKQLIMAYRKDMPKLIGVEMEGGGAAAALHSQKFRPRLMIIRGVSDLADGAGNADMKKRWRAYARDAAAAYALGLLQEGPVPAGLRTGGSTTQNPI